MRRADSKSANVNNSELLTSSKCSLFFRCLDAPGVLTDSMSGAVWTHPTLAYDSALKAPYTTLLNRDSATPLQSGSLRGYSGDKAVLIIVAGQIMGNFTGTGGLATSGGAELRVAIGNNDSGVSGGIFLAPGHPSDDSLSPMHCRIGPNGALSGRTTSPTSTSTFNGLDFIWVLKYEPGSNVTLFQIWNMAGTPIADTAEVALGSANTFNGFGVSSTFRFCGFKMYGMAIYEMPTLPADWASCILWSANSWAQGRRSLYPATTWK